MGTGDSTRTAVPRSALRTVLHGHLPAHTLSPFTRAFFPYRYGLPYTTCLLVPITETPPAYTRYRLPPAHSSVRRRAGIVDARTRTHLLEEYAYRTRDTPISSPDPHHVTHPGFTARTGLGLVLRSRLPFCWVALPPYVCACILVCPVQLYILPSYYPSSVLPALTATPTADIPVPNSRYNCSIHIRRCAACPTGIL